MYAMRKMERGIGLMSHEPLPKKLRDLFDHYEAAYYEFVVCLTAAKPVDDELLVRLLKFRVMKNAFFNELIRSSRPGLVSHMPGEEGHFKTALDARVALLDSFPSYGEAMERAAEAPVAYLPLIKVSEDPFSEILGQTMKLKEGSLISVKTGTGRELPTTMHESLHAAVRGLPGAFEEGFCRHALQSRKMEEDEMAILPTHDPATLRVNLAGIYYPNLLVNILAESAGSGLIERAFFGCDVTELDAFLRRAAGIGMEELDRPFSHNDPDGAARNVEALAKAFGGALSARLKAALDSVLSKARAGCTT